MKRIVSLTLLSSLVLATGCATTGAATEETSTKQMLTLEEALQKSAETRQKLLEAKQAYENVKSAAQASQTNNSDIATELAKQAIQSKVDDAKNQIEAEKQAWKDIFAD